MHACVYTCAKIHVYVTRTCARTSSDNILVMLCRQRPGSAFGPDSDSSQKIITNSSNQTDKSIAYVQDLSLSETASPHRAGGTAQPRVRPSTAPAAASSRARPRAYEAYSSAKLQTAVNMPKDQHGNVVSSGGEELGSMPSGVDQQGQPHFSQAIYAQLDSALSSFDSLHEELLDMEVYTPGMRSPASQILNSKRAHKGNERLATTMETHTQTDSNPPPSVPSNVTKGQTAKHEEKPSKPGYTPLRPASSTQKGVMLKPSRVVFSPSMRPPSAPALRPYANSLRVPTSYIRRPVSVGSSRGPIDNGFLGDANVYKKGSRPSSAATLSLRPQTASSRFVLRMCVCIYMQVHVYIDVFTCKCMYI
jgi:hypothetical protein